MIVTPTNVPVLAIGLEPPLRALVTRALRIGADAESRLVEWPADVATMRRACTEPFACVLVGDALLDALGPRCLDEFAAAPHAPAVIVLVRRRDRSRGARARQNGASDVVAWADVHDRLAAAIDRALARRRFLVGVRESRRRLSVTMRDPTTGALCRDALDLLLSERGCLVSPGAPSDCALFVDVDDLACINEVFGHEAGDAALAEVASRIRICARPRDHVARLGDDELLVLLPETRIEHAVALAERMRATVAAGPVVTGDGPMPVSISIAALRVHGESADELRERAVQMLVSRAVRRAADRVVRAQEKEVSSPETLRRWPLHVVGARSDAEATTYF